MRLDEILTAERIDPQFVAANKTAALEGLARLLTVDGSLEASDVTAVLQAREALQSTGVGSGVAIPHGRVQRLDRFVGALAIHHAGVPFDAIDGSPVHILFAVIGPERAAGEHLKCLARIGRLLREASVRERLQKCRTSADVISVVRGSEA